MIFSGSPSELGTTADCHCEKHQWSWKPGKILVQSFVLLHHKEKAYWEKVRNTKFNTEMSESILNAYLQILIRFANFQ